MSEDRSQYNPWPLGNLPKEFQRPEIDQLRAAGYEIDDPREANKIFEAKLCRFTGAKYAVLLDNCSNANFLTMKYHHIKMDDALNGRMRRHLPGLPEIVIPAKTYVSVPQSVRQAGWKIRLFDYNWSGIHQFDPVPVWDAAARFTQNMYIPGSMMNLSFQIKKRLPIGKGGCILLDDESAAEWFRKKTMQGRDINKAYDKDILEYEGWNMYMTPEDAARGILLFDMLTHNGEVLDFDDTMDQSNYTDLRTQRIFQ